jgi:hypothetical protein
MSGASYRPIDDHLLHSPEKQTDSRLKRFWVEGRFAGSLCVDATDL